MGRYRLLVNDHDENTPIIDIFIDEKYVRTTRGLTIHVDGLVHVECLDYDKNFDVFYHMSDDGSMLYQTAKLLPDTDRSSLLSREEMIENGKVAIRPVVDHAFDDYIALEDIGYLINVFSCPLYLMSRYQNKPVSTAMAEVVKEFYHI